MNKLRLACITGLLLCLALASCRREKDPLERIKVIDNPVVKVSSRPRLLAENLHNPMSPRLAGNQLVFAESGAGNISAVENGKARPLITGFVRDHYAEYDISAQGITIDPASGEWIVAAAEGPGRVLLFKPTTFPTDAKAGREIRIEGAVDDNPFEAVLAAGGRILVVSGGTKSAYQGNFDAVNPNPVRRAFEVDTGMIGVAVDPKSGDVFGAVFGKLQGDGYIIRWDAAKEPVVTQTIARGLTNPIDVAFTPDGRLLVLEFGEFGSKEGGRVSVVATDGSGPATPFITGLNAPSGMYVGQDNTLYVTEFGEAVNQPRGTLIAVSLAPAPQAR